MKRGHLAALRPVCPVCRAAPVAFSTVIHEIDEDVLEGILGCTNPECLREYPVIDGIPILVAAIRGWLAANPLQVLGRDDLSAEMESLLGDVLGPGSAFDALRQQVGIYADGHYGQPERLSYVSGSGPAIDIGCSVGGTTFALASRWSAAALPPLSHAAGAALRADDKAAAEPPHSNQNLTVGVDLNFAMLRVASRALREGRVRYAQRRVGIVYDRREFAVELPSRELVDFWCCDAAALPFADGTFGLASALNLLDCVPAPREVAAECARVLQRGAQAVFSTPYDWSTNATPVEQWLGGHSQRGVHRGAAEPMLRAVLAEHFEVVCEEENVPWRLRVHERSAMDYLVHRIVARRR